MRAGKLDSTIQIQRPFETVNSYGAFNVTWETMATLRAEIIEERTEELDRDPGTAGQRFVTFRMRYRDSVSLGDRILFDGEIYDLKSVTEIGRRRGLEVRAKYRGNV